MGYSVQKLFLYLAQYLKRARAINYLFWTTSGMEVVQGFSKIQKVALTHVICNTFITDTFIFRITLVENLIFLMLKWIETIMYLVMELVVQLRKIKIRGKSSLRFATQVIFDYIALFYAKPFELGKSEMLNAEKSEMHE